MFPALATKSKQNMSGSFYVRYRLLLMSLLTGVLLALSWPARGFPLLAFVALLPLLWVEDQLYADRARSRMVRIFVHAWFAFFVFNLFTTWWIMYASLPGMLVAVFLNPVFMSLPWVLMHLSRRLLPGRHGQASLVIFWLSFEYLHALWDLNWIWLELGNVFATVPQLVQWYEYTGTAGGTTWVMMVNLMLFSLLRPLVSGVTGQAEIRFFQKRSVVQASLILFVVLFPAISSLFVWHRYEEVYDPVEVVVIQPSHDPYEKVESFSEAEERIRIMTTLANTRIGPDTRFVVAPEGANPRGIWMHNDEDHFAVQMIREHISQHPQLVWVLGSFTYQLFEAGEERPPWAEPLSRDNWYVAYNSAIMIEADRPVVYHHKSKLVPGIERMPFFRVLRPLGKLVERFGGTQSSLGMQTHRMVFDPENNHPVAPAVCYESIYGQYMAEYIRNGAGLIFIITNDGWWRNTPGHRQHHHYARLRAIENRRSIARSASTGISSFIDQKGKVLKQTEWWESAAISHRINQNHTQSFFTKNGNTLGKLSLLLTALLLMRLITQRVISGKGR